MKIVFFAYMAIWILIMGFLMARGGYFLLMIANNRASGSQGGNIWDVSQYNLTGQAFRRKYFCLWAIAVVVGLGGMFLMHALYTMAW